MKSKINELVPVYYVKKRNLGKCIRLNKRKTEFICIGIGTINYQNCLV